MTLHRFTARRTAPDEDLNKLPTLAAENCGAASGGYVQIIGSGQSDGGDATLLNYGRGPVPSLVGLLEPEIGVVVHGVVPADVHVREMRVAV